MEANGRAQVDALLAGADLVGDLPDATPARRMAMLAEKLPRFVPFCCGVTALHWDGTAEPPTAATHPDLAELVNVQLRTGDGPIVTALGTNRPALAPDLLHDDRWPHFRAIALEAGIRSSATLPFRHEDVSVTLSVYRFRPGGLDAAERGPTDALGRLVTAAVARDRRYRDALATADQLDTALRSRPLVDQACGIVMHMMGCDADEAFGFLRRISQRTNRKLSDLAAEVVASRGRGLTPAATPA